MVKYKIERDAGNTFLVIQGQKGQQISQREYYAINTGQIPGLVRANMVQKGKLFKLCYNISGLISLREFLLNPLSKSSFITLLENILNNLKALHNSYYNQQYILMDINAAMLNPSTQSVSFVYVPIILYESGTNLKDFLLSIIQCCSFVQGEDTSYVQEYIRILNSGINFSVFDLEEYLKKLENKAKSQITVNKCPRCGNALKLNVSFCSSCGFKISGIVLESKSNVYDPAKNKFSTPPMPVTEIKDPPYTNIQSSELEGTISSSCINSGLLVTPQVQNKAILIRAKTGEQIVIAANGFRIGKDPANNEYAVTDNSAISRCHAVIKLSNGKWFITDLNSTNKTYINNSPLYPNIDVELFNGTNITLANEIFTFMII